jgi:hypothetical protein
VNTQFRPRFIHGALCAAIAPAAAAGDGAGDFLDSSFHLLHELLGVSIRTVNLLRAAYALQSKGSTEF